MCTPGGHHINNRSLQAYFRKFMQSLQILQSIIVTNCINSFFAVAQERFLSRSMFFALWMVSWGRQKWRSPEVFFPKPVALNGLRKPFFQPNSKMWQVRLQRRQGTLNPPTFLPLNRETEDHTSQEMEFQPWNLYIGRSSFSFNLPKLSLQDSHMLLVGM